MKGFGKEPTRGETDVIGARIGAQLFDTVVSVVIIWISMIILGSAGSSAAESVAGGLLGITVGLFLALGYFFILEGIWDGQTVGKNC